MLMYKDLEQFVSKLTTEELVYLLYKRGTIYTKYTL